MRKRLPPLFALQVFEAAARHGKFNLAARELALTQSVVSRQVKQLEDWSGLCLFSRHGPRVELTKEGQDLLGRLNAPLNALHAAVYSNAEIEQKTLQINTLASAALTLLLPQLAQFRLAHPDIRISMQADYALTSLPPQLATVAIRFTGRPDPSLQSHLLINDRLVVVGTPALVKKLGKNPAKWPAAQLLRHTYMDWSVWTSSQDLATPLEVDGLEFNDAVILLDAAKRGLGLGISRLSVAWESLEKGELVLASPHVCSSPLNFYLMYRFDCADNPAIRTFTDWVIEATKIWEKRLQQYGKKSERKVLKSSNKN